MKKIVLIHELCGSWLTTTITTGNNTTDDENDDS